MAERGQEIRDELTERFQREYADNMDLLSKDSLKPLQEGDICYLKNLTRTATFNKDKPYFHNTLFKVTKRQGMRVHLSPIFKPYPTKSIITSVRFVRRFFDRGKVFSHLPQDAKDKWGDTTSYSQDIQGRAFLPTPKIYLQDKYSANVRREDVQLHTDRVGDQPSADNGDESDDLESDNEPDPTSDDEEPEVPQRTESRSFLRQLAERANTTLRRFY